jgi:hypothetical protein
VVDHGQQLGVQGVQVDLVAQAGREPLEGAGGVRAAAVEAAVDQLLDPAAQGWNRAATVRVAAATARLPEPSTSLEAVGTTSR